MGHPTHTAYTREQQGVDRGAHPNPLPTHQTPTVPASSRPPPLTPQSCPPPQLYFHDSSGGITWEDHQDTICNAPRHPRTSKLLHIKSGHQRVIQAPAISCPSLQIQAHILISPSLSGFPKKQFSRRPTRTCPSTNITSKVLRPPWAQTWSLQEVVSAESALPSTAMAAVPPPAHLSSGVAPVALASRVDEHL